MNTATLHHQLSVGHDIHTPGRIGVDAVLEALELVHGQMMHHVLRLHLGHF